MPSVEQFKNFYSTPISQGTAFEDGVRVGPCFDTGSYNGAALNANVPVPNNPYFAIRRALSSKMGALLSPIVSYRVTPRTPAAAFTANNAICVFANLPAPLPFFNVVGDGFVATKIQKGMTNIIPGTNVSILDTWFPNGVATAVVLDCSRAVEFVATDNIANAVNINVFGLDMYSQPLVSQIAIQAGAANGTIARTPSTFSVIFGATQSAPFGATGSGFLQASSLVFGLPYYLESSTGAAVGYFSPAIANRNVTFLAGLPVNQTAPIVNPNISNQNVPYSYTVASPATATSADVRGRIVLTDPLPFSNTTIIAVQFYAVGFDNLINQKAAMNETAGGTPDNPNVYLPLNTNLQFGYTPYCGVNFANFQSLLAGEDVSKTPLKDNVAEIKPAEEKKSKK